MHNVATGELQHDPVDPIRLGLEPHLMTVRSKGLHQPGLKRSTAIKGPHDLCSGVGTISAVDDHL